MRKYTFLTLIIALLPTLSFGASRYTQLVREKQQKMEQLEKCMGAQKGLKIAGISTIGLTAVGVAGNIYEAKVIKDNEKTIEKTDKQITETKQQISEKLAAKAKKGQDRQKKIEQKEQKAQQASEEARKLNTVVSQDIASIDALGGNIGDKAIARGYQPEQLPTALSSKFATAMMGFINRCYGLKGKNGIEIVSAGSKTPKDWESFQSNNGSYKEDDVLPDLNENVIAECKVETCNETTHTKRGDRCVEISSDCTEEAKEKNANVVAATMNDGKCEIQQCTDGFEPNEDKTKCEEKKQEEDENTDNNETELTSEQKMDCSLQFMKEFPLTGPVPQDYMSKYNEYLNGLQRRVADKDGVLNYDYTQNYTKYECECKKGQKWSDCTNASVVLPAIAMQSTRAYAENIKCKLNTPVLADAVSIQEKTANSPQTTFDDLDEEARFESLTDIGKAKWNQCKQWGAKGYNPKINQCYCSGNDVWVPDMRECQSPETAAANAEFDKNFADCIKHGASGYSVERGVCLCEDETLYEYDGTKCVRKQEKTIKISTAELKCDGFDGYWNGNTCECPSYKPYWDATNYECMENPVPSAPAPMGQILAVPQVEEAATTTLPDRSATSYFAH